MHLHLHRNILVNNQGLQQPLDESMCLSWVPKVKISRSFFSIPSQSKCEATSPSNKTLFLCFQMFQAARIVISLNAGLCQEVWAVLNIIWIFLSFPHWIPTVSQHLIANGHSWKRCMFVSSTSRLHMRQEWSSPILKWLHRSISLVFTLSINMSHAKTLCLMMHLDFHIEVIWVGAVIFLKRNL